MRWFKREKKADFPGEVQLRGAERHPFGMLGDYVPLSRGEAQLYRAVREAVPVVDAAIYKLIRMTGAQSGSWGSFCGLCRWDGDNWGSTPFWTAIWIRF